MSLFPQRLHEQRLEVLLPELINKSPFKKAIWFSNTMTFVLKLLHSNCKCSVWLSTTAVNLTWGCFQYFITALRLRLSIFVLPHKNSFSTRKFSIHCTWLAADMTLNLFCYKHHLQPWEDCFVPKCSQGYMLSGQLRYNETHKWNLSTSCIYSLTTTNSYLLPLHKTNSNAFLDRASELK